MILAAPGTGAPKPTATPVPGRIIPTPAECRAVPRSPQSVVALTTLPHPHPSGGDGTPRADDPTSPDLLAGEVDNAATIAGVRATAREAIACLNAGDVLRRLALYSDDGVRRVVDRYGAPADVTLAGTTPVPLAVSQRVALVDVRDVQVLRDGRIHATVVQDAPADPRHEEPSTVIFVEHGDRWLIDDVVVLPATGGVRSRKRAAPAVTDA